MSRDGAVLVAAVVANAGLTAVHGLAHAAVPIHVHSWQYGVATATVAVSLVGAGFTLRGRLTAGALLAGLGGAAALGFEGLVHFVVSNPDHVAVAGAGAGAGAGDAFLLTTVGDAALVAVSAAVLVQDR